MNMNIKTITKSEAANKVISQFCQILFDEMELSGDSHMILGKDFFEKRGLDYGDARMAARKLVDEKIIEARSYPNIIQTNLDRYALEIDVVKEDELEAIASFKPEIRKGQTEYRDNGKLIVPGQGKGFVQFDGELRRQIVGFFYNLEDRKEWKTYADIRASIGNESSKIIREAISGINKRCTNDLGIIIIASRKVGSAKTSEREYRWAL
jgi:hypothetical protein